MAKKRTLAQAVAQARPRVAKTRLCLRGDLVEEHERLTTQLGTQPSAATGDAMHSAPTPEARALAQRIVDLEAEMREAEIEFVFEAIGKPAWSDLIAEHPPTKAHKELRLDHNPETFSVAAIVASIVEPADSTLEDVLALAAKTSLGQWQKLWTACLDANLGAANSGESEAASAILRASTRSSDTADLAASPEASS